jgi:hypothetical protein
VDEPLQLLLVIAGAEPPERQELDATMAERFEALADAVVTLERAFERTYEGADPTTQRRLNRLRGQSTKATAAMAAVIAVTDDLTDDDIEAARPGAAAALAKLGIGTTEGE